MNKENLNVGKLTDLLHILKREKEALIKNEGTKIEAIVKEKEIFLSELPDVDFSKTNQADIKTIVKEIRELQETNLMLTKQTLAFQEVLLSAISKGIKQSGNTYSNKGQHTAREQASLLNQSL